jgi:hypothetical protein
MDDKMNDVGHNRPLSDSVQLGNPIKVLHRSALSSSLHPATSNVL